MQRNKSCSAQTRKHKSQVNLRDDDIGQSSRQPEQLQRVLQGQRGVVLRVVLDAVVDVGDLADVVAAILGAEVPLQFGPALQHQLQCLTVVELQVCEEEQQMLFNSSSYT